MGDLACDPGDQRTDTLISNDVYNLKDEDLGDLKEIMLDMRTGRVSYAALSFGGFLGMGEKLFAVPWNALTLGHREQTLHAECRERPPRKRAWIRPGQLAQYGRPIVGAGHP